MTLPSSAFYVNMSTVNRSNLESLLQVATVDLMRMAAVGPEIAFYDTRDMCSYLHFEMTQRC